MQELAHGIHHRLLQYPSTHLVVMDGELGVYPDLSLTEKAIYGPDVVAALRERDVPIPCIGFSNAEFFREGFLAGGADGFVRKTIPPVAAVEQMAGIFGQALRREIVRLLREVDPSFE